MMCLILIFAQKSKVKWMRLTSGDWEGAAEIFQETELMLKDEADYKDGPSTVLYNFMKNRDFSPGENWEGYRSLTSK